MIASPRTRREKVFVEQTLNENQQIVYSYYYATRQLGKGGFATCYEVKVKNQAERYAIKVIPKKNTNIGKDNFFKKINNQIDIMSSLNHEGIVKYHRDFKDNENVYIVIQLCTKGSLSDIIKQRKILTEPEIRFLAVQFISILQQLRKYGVIHRDIKLANCFIDKDLNLKLGDFGLATFNDQQFARKRTVCGTPNYIAPQIIEKKPYSYQVDLWSFGIVMYQCNYDRFTLFFGVPPFQTKSCKQTYEMIKKCQYQFKGINRHIQISQDAKSFIKEILKLEPERRLKLIDMMDHPFISNYTIPLKLEPNFTTHHPSHNFTLIYSKPIVQVQKKKRSKTIKSREKSKEKGKSSNTKKRPVFLYKDLFIKKYSLEQQQTQSIKKNHVKEQFQLFQTRKKEDMRGQQQELNVLSGEKSLQNGLDRQNDEGNIEQISILTKSLIQQQKIIRVKEEMGYMVKEQGAFRDEMKEQDIIQQAKSALEGMSLKKEGFTRLNIKSEFKPQILSRQQRIASLSASSIMIKQWINLLDYAGFIFMLTNFQIGFFFNDKTKMMLCNDDQIIEYNDEKSFVSLRLGVKDDPVVYNKISHKIVAFKHYAGILRSKHYHQYQQYKRNKPITPLSSMKYLPFFITQFFTEGHIIIFRMHNGDIQCYFHDGRSIFISFYSKFMVYNHLGVLVRQIIPFPRKKALDDVFYNYLHILALAYQSYEHYTKRDFEIYVGERRILQQMLFQ